MTPTNRQSAAPRFTVGQKVFQVIDGKFAGIVVAAGAIVQVRPLGKRLSKYYAPESLTGTDPHAKALADLETVIEELVRAEAEE